MLSAETEAGRLLWPCDVCGMPFGLTIATSVRACRAVKKTATRLVRGVATDMK